MVQVSAASGQELPATFDAKARKALAVQVTLDRAGFSPGEIDGRPGMNTERALQSYKQAGKVSPVDGGKLGGVEPAVNPIASYAVTPEDAAGPFAESIPADMMEKSKLPSLMYSSLLELLSERFHASPRLLQRMNPKAAFAAGETIVVPNVEPFVPPAPKGAKPQPEAAANGAKPAAAARPSASATTVIVTDATKTLEVQDASGETILHAPVSIGSKNDPLPVGEWKVNGVSSNPTFNYNPDLFWDADPSHAKAKIPAGPNNPVGVVWIDLSKEHYGIHGTPEPSRIGYTESHGCIRLTNWDAMRLAALVAPGTKVILR